MTHPRSNQVGIVFTLFVLALGCSRDEGISGTWHHVMVFEIPDTVAYEDGKVLSFLDTATVEGETVLIVCDGMLRGTMQHDNRVDSIEGSLSHEGAVTLRYEKPVDAGFQRFRMSGTYDEMKNEISGTCTIAYPQDPEIKTVAGKMVLKKKE